MRISTTKPLFAWGCLDDSPSLHTVKEFLAVVPGDGKGVRTEKVSRTEKDGKGVRTI